MNTELIEREDLTLLPEQNEIDLKQKLTEIVAYAESLEMDNEAAFHKITAMYAQSKEWEKLIEFLRKQANAPDQSRINARNDKAKEVMFHLKKIQEIAKSKSASYQERLEDIKRQEEEKMRAAVALLELEEVPYIPPAEKTQRGDGATAYTRTVRKFRIVDEEKVERKYLKIDEEAIERAIKLGLRELSGVEIFEEKETILRTR